MKDVRQRLINTEVCGRDMRSFLLKKSSVEGVIEIRRNSRQTSILVKSIIAEAVPNRHSMVHTWSNVVLHLA